MSDDYWVDDEPRFSFAAGGFVADLLSSMFASSAATTNALIGGYQAQIESLEAELYAIRTGVSELLNKPWTPSSDAIRQAVFFPPSVLMDEYRANKEVGW